MLVTDILTGCTLLRQDKLSQHQRAILDAGVFSLICEELKDYFIKEYKPFHRLLKTINQEQPPMFDEPLAKCVINDILSSGMYTLTGLANYTQSNEDVMYDIASGQNRDPSATLFSRIIKLHQTVRPELYREILRKLITA